MLSLATYKLLHILGVAGLVVALAGVCVHAANDLSKNENRLKKLLSGMHGAAAFLILVSGFGMLAKLAQAGGSAFPVWVWPKLVVWVLLGLAISFPYRKRAWAMPILILLPLLVLVAATFALLKPFA